MVESNIELPEDGKCAFCAYLRGERPYTILKRDEMTATLVTREQRGKPHLLVIPISQRSTIIDLKDDEAKALIIAVQDAVKMIDKAYARPGVAVWQNNGISANQSISHIHFHVAGTLDEGGTEWGEVEELSVEKTDDIAEFIRRFRE